MKEKVLAVMRGIEVAVGQRWIFLVLAWLAVVTGLGSIFFGARWALAGCALALGVIAHSMMVVANSAWLLAHNFEAIRTTYAKDVGGGMKPPAAAQSGPAVVN